eukprot:GEMP01001147.1.p1 GENE.GEMP01001147.1~~GEMP01001147.1.p1  ORF type:complete len:1555 (+),score=360.02 GEMP01001147.1:269-4933(+)
MAFDLLEDLKSLHLDTGSGPAPMLKDFVIVERVDDHIDLAELDICIFNALLHGKQCALKFLLPKAGADRRRLYLREYIVEKYVAPKGECAWYQLYSDIKGVLFYSLPYGACRSLPALVCEMDMPERAILWLVGALAHLQRAQELGVIHLNICPQNILLRSPSVTAFCAGWGYATVDMDNPNFHKCIRSWTNKNDIRLLNSAAEEAIPLQYSPFMPKESNEYAADPTALDASADLYALAATICTAWKLQFDIDPDESYMPQELFQRRRDLREVLGGDFEAVLLRALAKEKHLRYTSASEMLTDVSQCSVSPKFHIYGPSYGNHDDDTALNDQNYDGRSRSQRGDLSPPRLPAGRSWKDDADDVADALPTLQSFADIACTGSMHMRLPVLNNCGLLLISTALLELSRASTAIAEDVSSFPTATHSVTLRIDRLHNQLSTAYMRLASELLVLLHASGTHAVSVSIKDVVINIANCNLKGNEASFQDEDILSVAIYFSARVKIEGHGASVLCKCLNMHPSCTVRDIDFEGQKMDDQMIRDLFSFLSTNPLVDTLGLARTGPYKREWCMRLNSVLLKNTNLTRLYMDQNAIDNNSGIVLAQALLENKTLMVVTLDNNPFSAEVVPLFAKAMLAIPGRIIRVTWLSMRLQVTSIGYHGGSYMSCLDNHAQRLLSKYISPANEDRYIQWQIAPANISAQNVGDEEGASQLSWESKHARGDGDIQHMMREKIRHAVSPSEDSGGKNFGRTGVTKAQVSELFNTEGSVAFLCESVGMHTIANLPDPLRRWTSFPLPLSLVPLVLQERDVQVLEFLPILKEFYFHYIAVHPEPVLCSLRYACLLEFVSEFHTSCSEALKQEAMDYKEIAARIFARLPMSCFPQMLGSDDMTDLTLECAAVQLARQPRFTYLVNRMWTSSTGGMAPCSKKRKNPIVACILNTSPRTRFFQFAIAQLAMNGYVHWVIYRAHAENVRNPFLLFWTVCVVLFEIVECCSSPTEPKALASVRCDAFDESFGHRTELIRRAVDCGSNLKDMYVPTMVSYYWHSSWNYLDVLLCGVYILWWVSWMYIADNSHDIHIMVLILSCTLLLLWLRMINILSIFRRFAHLIDQAAGITHDVFAFLILYFILLFAFSSMLHAVAQHGNCFENYQVTVLHVFRSSLLDFNEPLECLYQGTNDFEGKIAFIVFVGWLLLAAVQLFNLIIAIFTTNYERMGPDTIAKQNFERLFLIREHRQSSDFLKFPPPLNSVVYLVLLPLALMRCVKKTAAAVSVYFQKDLNISSRRELKILHDEEYGVNLAQTDMDVPCQEDAVGRQAGHILRSAFMRDSVTTGVEISATPAEFRKRISDRLCVAAESREATEHQEEVDFKDMSPTSSYLDDDIGSSPKALKTGNGIHKCRGLRMTMLDDQTKREEEEEAEFDGLAAQITILAHGDDPAANVLQGLHQMRIWPKIRSWVELFRATNESSISWKAMRFSLRMFGSKPPVKPAMSFHVVQTIIGEYGGVSAHHLSTLLQRQETLFAQRVEQTSSLDAEMKEQQKVVKLLVAQVEELKAQMQQQRVATM